jgi:hypothetical protein
VRTAYSSFRDLSSANGKKIALRIVGIPVTLQGRSQGEYTQNEIWDKVDTQDIANFQNSRIGKVRRGVRSFKNA